MYSRQHADLRKPLKATIEAYTDWQLRLRNLKEAPKNHPKASEELKQYDFVLESATDAVNGALKGKLCRPVEVRRDPPERVSPLAAGTVRGARGTGCRCR